MDRHDHIHAIGKRFDDHFVDHGLDCFEARREVLDTLGHPVLHHAYGLAELDTPEAAKEGRDRLHASLLLMLSTVEHFAARSLGAETITQHNVMDLDPETIRVLTGLRQAVGEPEKVV